MTKVYACRSRKGAQRSGHIDDSTIQLEPRVHPLGGDETRWHGTNFGRRAMEQWERAAALTDVFTPPLLCYSFMFLSCVLIRFPKDPPTETEDITPEQNTTKSEPSQQFAAIHEPDNLGGIQRSASSEGCSAEGQYKPSLREKIAGGMKVVTGKLGHDKSKVEEGKKLLHGQSA